ncbi:MAG: N-6 DNA methylase [Acidobacteriia bacterium]|nr:N-6 DNA methylase [Terriglobia bacterium]
MLPGVDGHLLSSTLVERRVSLSVDTLVAERVRRELVGWRERCRALGPASSLRALLQHGAAPLAAALGFDPPAAVEAAGPALAATLLAGGHAVALLVAPWGEPLDPLWRLAVTQALSRASNWCLLFDGLHLRIVDAGRLYARRHAQFDLDLAIDHPRAFAALWCTARASSLTADAADAGSLHALVAASDRHASAVCRSLRDGVLTASGDVLQALVTGRPAARLPPVGDSFEQALTIVYRMLFLLFAEARALVPLWHPVYRESYSLETLRDLAERSGRTPGLWDALRAMARLAHAGCHAGDLRVTPFNGRLFAPARTPLAERRDLDDEAARRAVLALSTRPAPDRVGRERIAYRELGVEQLGAVYETLLDYTPRIERASQARGRARTPLRTTVTLESGSGVRKATGTFYTPQPIADYLVRRTLGPLVRDATPDRIFQLRIVDPAMGSGAFLVAACRYLAGAYEEALVRAGGCHASDIDDAERVTIRRTIAERCLYGVDLNPMAVQLARLSLWLATLAVDRPLSFLDHRLQTGDSLLGAWLANLRHPPDTRKRARADAALPNLPLFGDDTIVEALRETLPMRFTLESTPNDTLAQVRAKERAFAALTAREAALSRWKRVAHLWCAAWFTASERAAPASAFGSLSDAILSGRSALPGHTADRLLDAANRAAEAFRFFHWELEFPEVFFDGDGRRLPRAGFDAVIGNPPWDMMRADAGAPAARASARETVAAMLRFTRDAGVYTAQSDGHANRYQLFVERAMALTRPGGRFGLVLPSGLATDHGSARLRRRLLARCDADALIGIDNHLGVFPIHRSMRFLLLTASAGSPTTRLACRTGVSDPSELESIGEEPADASPWFPVRITPAWLERVSGPGLAIPAVRDATDLAIIERAASLFPPLGSEAGWSARFGRELNASDDAAAFRSDRLGLPVIDGKHLEPFRVLLGSVRRSIGASEARRLLRADRHERPRLAYRDVASATNRLTFIAAVLPARSVSTHTAFCLRAPLPLRAQHFLCGLFNSFVVNYLVRLRVTTHVTAATVEQLPIPTAGAAPGAFAEIAALAHLLSRRPDPSALARLNARVAELYQLSVAEFEHVLETFPLIPSEERKLALSLFSGRGH